MKQHISHIFLVLLLLTLGTAGVSAQTESLVEVEGKVVEDGGTGSTLMGVTVAS